MRRSTQVRRCLSLLAIWGAGSVGCSADNSAAPDNSLAVGRTPVQFPFGYWQGAGEEIELSFWLDEETSKLDLTTMHPVNNSLAGRSIVVEKLEGMEVKFNYSSRAFQAEEPLQRFQSGQLFLDVQWDSETRVMEGWLRVRPLGFDDSALPPTEWQAVWIGDSLSPDDPATLAYEAELLRRQEKN